MAAAAAGVTRRDLRPGQRVPAVLRHAGGVRPPALRGRLAALRPPRREPRQGRSSPTSPGASTRGEPAPDAVRRRPAQRRLRRRRAVRARRRPRARLEEATAPTVRHLEHARFAWSGGPRGLDRPLDRAFVTIEREVRGRLAPVHRRPRAADRLAHRRRRALHRRVGGPDRRPARHLPLPRHRQPLRLVGRAFDVVATNDLVAIVANGRVRLRLPGRRARRTCRPSARRIA